jgi:hypothetical protein
MADEKIQDTIDNTLADIFKMMDAEVAKWSEGSLGHSLALQVATNSRNLLLQMDEWFKSDAKMTGIDRLASQVAREAVMSDIDALKALGTIAELPGMLV